MVYSHTIYNIMVKAVSFGRYNYYIDTCIWPYICNMYTTRTI